MPKGFEFNSETNEVTFSDDFSGDRELAMNQIPKELREETKIYDSNNPKPAEEPKPEAKPELGSLAEIKSGKIEEPKPETPVINYSRFGKEIKTEDELFTSYEALRNSNLGHTQTIEGLTKERDGYKTNSTFKDDEEYKLVMLRRDDPDSFNSYMRLKSGGIESDVEVLALSLIGDNPDAFKDSKEAMEYVESKYYQDSKIELLKANDDMEDDEKNDIKRRNFQLTRDNEEIERKNKFKIQERGIEASKSRKQLLTMADKYKMPEAPDPEKVIQEKKDYEDKWLPAFNDDYAKVSSVQLGEGVEYELSESDKRYFMANAAEFVSRQKLEVDSASKEKVKQYATNALWIHPEIRGLMLEKHAKRVREMNDDEWEKYEEKKYHNPTPLGKSEIKPPETDFNKKDKESTNQYFSDRGIPPEA